MAQAAATVFLDRRLVEMERVVAEVDLSQRHFWRNNLGDFRAENRRSRPIAFPESKVLRKQ